jgi:hypothetical protein
LILIQFGLVKIQRAERADLKYPRLLNQHGHRAALRKICRSRAVATEKVIAQPCQVAAGKSSP